MTPLFTTLTSILAGLVPKAAEDCYTYIKDKTGTKKRVYTKLSAEQTEKLILMWAAWEKDKSLYTTRTEFATEVNRRFGTKMSQQTLISRIKRLTK
jgi:hypothetical protein